ncbi:MAG: LptF/LptG family permease [Candidatus Brocadiia bacterium]|nr:MAG: LptF/LptG family permease [Candidatus Brocadiia bacterium]
MKILDRYVAKNFLIGYVIAFSVLVGLTMIIDLFVSLDEFSELSGYGTYAVAMQIINYYAVQSTVYFRDFAGMITVVAAVFSLARMVRSNELVAVMASGVSLQRVIAPIIVLALLLTGILVIDQGIIIPALSDKLVRSKDLQPGQESYDVWFIDDKKGSLICSTKFDVKTATMFKPSIITRSRSEKYLWEVDSWVTADKAVYNLKNSRWDLFNVRISTNDSPPEFAKSKAYVSDIQPKDIPVRRKSQFKSLLSWAQLNSLARQGTKIKDLAQLYALMHFHITDPIINFIMLMVSLPILVCRDPKTMKTSIVVAFTMVTGCFVMTFLCKMFATEVVFDKFRPELWAWLPVFIFLPVAFIEIDSMKT